MTTDPSNITGPAETRPLATADAPTRSVPLPLSSFVGRERQLEEVKRLLTGTRLLTLTGSGGVGKTRLALEVARDLDTGKKSVDDVCVAGLAPLADAALVPHRIAVALGIREEPGHAVLETVQE